MNLKGLIKGTICLLAAILFLGSMSAQVTTDILGAPVVAQGPLSPKPSQVHEAGIGGLGPGMPMQSRAIPFDNPNYRYLKVIDAGSETHRSAALRPQGDKFATYRTYTDAGVTKKEIFLYNLDGTGGIMVSPGDSDPGGAGDIYGHMNPMWSDDGSKLTWTEAHKSNPNKVMVYDMATATTSYLYEPVAPLDVCNHDYLGNTTTKIVFWDWIAADGAADLFIYDNTTGTRTNITNSPLYSEYEPVSNPAGDYIVYWSGEKPAEPVNTTHILKYNPGTGNWDKDVGFTPIPDTYWAFYTGRSGDQIGLTVMSSKDIHMYDADGSFAFDVTGPGYSGGAGLWTFFGSHFEGPPAQLLFTSNADNSSGGRDVYLAIPLYSEVWVDDDWVGSSFGQEVASGKFFGFNAFAEIQDGIDAVAGSIVNVAAGTYAEYLIINKDNLTIQGAGIDLSIIDLDGLTPYWHYGTCDKSFASRAGVYFSGYGNPDEIVENCTFRGFTVKNAGLNPPITATGTHTGPNDQLTTLTDNTKAWTPGALVGQWIHNYGDKDPSDWKPARSYGLITANTATTVTATLAGGVENDWDNGDPYLITPYEEFHNTYWIHYTNYDGLRGISIGNGKNILISNCKVTDCGYGGITTGYARCVTTHKYSEDITIDNCIVTDHPTAGISIGSNAGPFTVTNNTCERIKRPAYADPTREYVGFGITVGGKSSSLMASGLISGNTCSDNGFIGIILKKYVDGITIEDNIVTGHNLDQDGAGIFFYHWGAPEYNKNHIIRNNTVTGNIRGIVAYYASYCTIEDNTITTDAGSFDKGQAGIKLDWANNITVKDNNLSSLDGKGINVSNSYDNIIGCSGNTIDGAMYSGILVRGSDSYGNTFTDNVITGSSFAGIFIRSGAYNNTFTDNTITATTVTTGKFLRAYGTHDGGDNASILSDGTQSWTVDGLKDLVVYNIDDGSSGIITANTATTVTATLSGGDNDWDFGDSYEIYYEESQGDGVLLFGYSDFVSDLSAGTGNVFHYNSIYGNADDGMENQVSSKMIVDAENNRWGSADGPEDLIGTDEATYTYCPAAVADMINEVGEISGKLGNGVSENVDYCPWLGVSGFDAEIYAGCNDPCDNFCLDFKLSGTDVRFFHFEYPLPSCIIKVSSSGTHGDLIVWQTTMFGDVLHIDGSFDPNFTDENVTIGEVCFTHDGGCQNSVQTLTCTSYEVRDGDGNLVDVSPGEAIINLDNTPPTKDHPGNQLPCYSAPDDPDWDCWNLNFYKGGGEWQCDLLQATIRIYEASGCGSGDLIFTNHFFTTPIPGNYNICYPTNQTDRDAIWTAIYGTATPPFDKVHDGTYYVELTVRDSCCNVDSNCDAFTFCTDTYTDNYMTCLDARPAHNHICLEWNYTPHATNAVKLQILRSPYRAGNYPVYAASDPVPDSANDPTWYKVYEGTDTYPCDQSDWYNDDGFAYTTRDIYWYAGFTCDEAGNWSARNMTLGTGADRMTSYWLGDVTNFDGTGDPEGKVLGAAGDVHRLSVVYGSSSPATDPEVDYGPETQDHGIGRGIPMPDDVINYQDLLPFSFNYNIVGPLDDCDNWPLLPGMNPPRQLNKNVDEIAAVWLKQVESNHPGGITFALMLTNPGDATHLFHSRISYNPGVLSLVEVRRGKVGISEGFAEFFGTPITGNGLVDVDLAALGPDGYLIGSGAVAYLDFSYEASEMASVVRLEEAILYDGEGNEINLSPTDVEVENQGEAIPTQFALHHNHPNPFNPATTIKYDLPQACHVKLVVYNVRGQKVATLVDGMVEAGRQQVIWNAKDLSSGIYFYKITAGNFTKMHKMILLK